MTSPTVESAPALRVALHFASLPDPRVEGRCDHPLLTIVVMALAAVVAGCRGWDEIHEFGVDRRDWFARFLELPHGVPSADTFRRVFAALRPDAFAACMRSWVASLAEPLGGEVVAFDGKRLRGAIARAPLGATLHLVHVWATRQHLLLAQSAVALTPDEVPAVRDLLELIDVRDAILTGDSAHCAHATAQTILDGGADYVLQLKGNRGDTYGRVRHFFAAAEAEDFADVEARHDRRITHAHGRVEIREATTVPASACPLAGRAWPGLQSLTRIVRTRIIGTKEMTETHYYLSSLPPRVRRIAAAAREHWGVENGLHWVLDVQMGEDASAVHDENAAQNLSLLRRLALMMIRREDTLKRGVAARQAKAARNTDYLERVLTRGITRD